MVLQSRFEPSLPSFKLPAVTIKPFTLKSLELNLPTPTCVQTIKPDRNGHVPPGTFNVLWSYYPGFIAAVVTASVFGLLTMLCIGEAVYFENAYCWVLCNQRSAGIITISQLSILLAPLWMNAFSSMVLGRMIHFYIPNHRLLRLKASTFATCFVLFDIICFIIQLIGGDMAGVGAPPEQMKTGLDIY
ncbi:uncharacterized protein RCO7_06697 [Rhynchosporium graminicola]|uniref:Uncharacterized protein n=1 Tax=Rhynchosporium graminicola TaxID=2792576 RepID=A0A1E1JYK8_9HELO|nr:uncharacterized protein RCO7_06697 [Rhynchosporium commune]